jgi:DNA polymerase IV
MIRLWNYHFPCAGVQGMCEHLLVVARSGVELGLNTAEPATLVIDLNCAFASIEQQHDPALRGRPLAIAAYATDAATIVSSSREARDLGIKTGMRVFEAKAIFPRIVVREPNPPRYRAASDQLIEIMERHTPDVLRMSIDEASMNLAGTPDLTKLGPEGVGRAIKSAIRAEIGECVTCSVGISTSIWMAKQASNLDKRDGLQRIDHTNLVAVFERLQLTDLSGIAEATATRLRKAGIQSALDLLYATIDRLGHAGMHEEVANSWHQRLRGFEASSFESAARKSYSHSHVLARATSSQAELEELLMRLSDMVGRRLRSAGRRGSVVSIGVVYRPDAARFSKQSKLAAPVATGDEIYRAALKLMAARDTRRKVGTLGVGLAVLSQAGPGQMELFADPSPPRGARLEKAIDAIRDRFGEDAVQRARLLGRAPVVRDRIAFGNTGHPDEKRANRDPGA